jgi:hypothetical protein
MKLNPLIKYLIVSLSLVVFGTVTTQSASAKTRYLTNVPDYSFLETKRTIHTTNDYFNDVKITIPKGTIFQATGVSIGVKTGHPFLSIDLNGLSWHLRKIVIDSKHDQQSTASLWLTTANFKRVRTPRYLAYYQATKRFPASYRGILHQGDKYPQDDSDVTAKSNEVRVTNDGYLEYTENASVQATKQIKPQYSVKVQRTIKKGNNTYLYTASNIPAIPSTHIRSTGKYQYRFKFINTNQHLVTTNPSMSNPDVFGDMTVVVRYYVGNTQTKYYLCTQFISK